MPKSPSPDKPDHGATPRFVWQDASATPMQLADMLHYRIIQDRCYLTVGRLQVPLVEGPLAPGIDLQILPLGQYAVSRETLRSWAQLLNAAADKLDAEILTR